MKVKIGDKMYDREKEPIMIVLSQYDKDNIANMLPHCTKYCSFPDDISTERIEKWMGGRNA